MQIEAKIGSSWWNRSWLYPFVDMRETALAALPGMNYFTAQVILYQQRLSMGEFIRMRLDHAITLFNGFIREDQLVTQYVE